MSKLADIVRIPEPSKELYDLNDLIKSVSFLMNTNCPDKSITWQHKLSEEPFIVNIDVRQMEQVLINIFKNAIEAIDQDGTITTQTIDNERRLLKIIDNGIGIDRKTKENLFTPFYSTKRDGQGIGLTFIREILINHGFDFDLDTTKPGHTEFWIVFKEK
jgi:nitrogen fixation/metabolism regulation signal transduction histidine kinase